MGGVVRRYLDLLIILLIPITRSFLMCGISACVDGTEDASFHCLKSGRVASETLPTVTKNTANFLYETRRQDNND